MDAATGEILSNTYMHAYNAGVGPVHVEVFRLRWTVTVLVIDTGNTAVAPAIPQALHHHTRPGGRGLYLASRMSDKLTIRTNTAGPGLTVRMTKWFEEGLIQAERARQYRRFRPRHGDGFESIRDVWATTSTA
jgi:anti-sigma regulatory factor (Ser/Thr protein kinase)